MHVGNLRMQENVFIIYDLIMLITLACTERVTVVTNVIIVAIECCQDYRKQVNILALKVPSSSSQYVFG